MARFLVERFFSRITEAELEEIATRSKRVAAADFPEITWEHSHVVTDDSGEVISYCVYDAPSESVVRRHAEAFGSHSVGRVYEIVNDVTPADLPDS